jgi:hypothetical protein
MPDTAVKSRRMLLVRTSHCGVNDELRWLELRVRSELQPRDDGPRAVSLAQISLQLSQLRREHFDACDLCGERQWIG